MALCMDEVTRLLPADTPDEVSLAWVAATFGVTISTVWSAVAAGKLPSRRTPTGGAGSKPAIWVRPEHALLIWGHKLLNATNGSGEKNS